MKTWVHFAASLILAAILYPLYNWKVILVFAGGVLIDIDHYFWYIYKYRKFNIFQAYKFFLKNMIKRDFSSVSGILLIFHTIEFLLIIVILSIYLDFIFIFATGLLLHYLLDLIYLYSVPKQFIANHSIIYWIYRNKIQNV